MRITEADVDEYVDEYVMALSPVLGVHQVG